MRPDLGSARENELVEPSAPVGTILECRRFQKPSSGGCARGWEPVGWNDFPCGGFRLEVALGVQRVRIEPSANTCGEAGVERYLKAGPGETYRLTARLNVTEKTDGFKTSIGLVPRRADGAPLAAFTATQEEASSEPTELVVEATTPPDTTLISAEMTSHTPALGEGGSTEIYTAKLERLR